MRLIKLVKREHLLFIGLGRYVVHFNYMFDNPPGVTIDEHVKLSYIITYPHEAVLKFENKVPESFVMVIEDGKNEKGSTIIYN